MNICFSPWKTQVSNSMGVFKQPLITFGSILAQPEDFVTDDFKHSIWSSSTMLSSHLLYVPEIVKSFNGELPIKIDILGGSDGSEAYAYGLEAKRRKQTWQITTVDDNPAFAALGEKGFIYLSDSEVGMANEKFKSPFLKLKPMTPASRSFSELKKNSPFIQNLDNTSKHRGGQSQFKLYISDVSIRPKFLTDDILKYVEKKENNSKKTNQVYVITDVLSYLLLENRERDIEKLFEVIKEKHKNDNVFLVFGQNHDFFLFPKGQGRHIAESNEYARASKVDGFGRSPVVAEYILRHGPLPEHLKGFLLPPLLEKNGFQTLKKELFMPEGRTQRLIGDYFVWKREATP